MRITNNSQEELLRILNAITSQNLRNVEIGELSVSTIDLVLTDFLVSTANREIIRQFHLQ
jgi:hypothetical protein